MKSITIHKVEDPIVELIRQRADAEGISVNQVVKKLLEEALGVKPSKSSRHAEDFREFLGRWSDQDCDSFEQTMQDMEKVNDGDWQ
jgi:hypothetical protein